MHTIDLSQIWPHVNQGLLAIFLVLAGWLVWEARSWLSIHAKFLSATTQKNITDNLNALLNDAINYAMNIVGAEEKKVNPTTDSLVVSIAANFAANHSGSEIDKTSDQLKQLIISKLPSPQTAEDTTGKTVQTSTITVETIPPIGDNK